MPFAVSYTTGHIVRSPQSTEPPALLHAEQFESEGDAISRALEILDEEEFHCVLIHGNNDEVLYTEADLRRMHNAIEK